MYHKFPQTRFAQVISNRTCSELYHEFSLDINPLGPESNNCLVHCWHDITEEFHDFLLPLDRVDGLLQLSKLEKAHNTIFHAYLMSYGEIQSIDPFSGADTMAGAASHVM